MTRLLFATDPHGNEAAYEELLARARDLRPDAIVLGGDLLPLPHGGDRLRQQLAFAREWLPAWARRAREASGAAVFAIFGNDDWACCAPHLERASGGAPEQDASGPRGPGAESLSGRPIVPARPASGLRRTHHTDDLTLLHGRAAPLGPDLWIAGYPCVPVTPFSMSDWDRLDFPGWRPPRPPKNVVVSEVEGDGGRIKAGSLDDLAALPTIEDDLVALARESDPARTVYVVHTPPWGTALDVMHGGTHIGSRALREFLQRAQPPLSLHGHVHESPRLTGRIDDRLGRTLCVNPGASRQRLHAVLVDTDALERRATPV